MNRTNRTSKRHDLYVVGKKLQEKKVNEASLTQATMPSDTPVELSVEEGSDQEPEKRTSSNRAISEELNITERKRSSFNFLVKQRIDRQAMARAQSDLH